MTLCRPIWKWHAWRPWVATRRYTVMTQYTLAGVSVGEPYACGERLRQERVCERCGIVQSREVQV